MKLVGAAKKKGAGLLLFFAMIILVLLGPLAYLMTSYYPHALFTYQEAVDGVKDCTNYSLITNTWERLNGQWSFYYDRWIVSDQDSGERDGVIDPMSSWANYTLPDGTRLPREGYASYALEVKGAPEGMPLVFDYLAFDGAYRLFVDGELTLQAGTLSKDIREVKKASFFTFHKDGVVPQGGSFRIVAELAANDHGGAFSPPCLVPNYQPGTAEDSLTKMLPFVSGGLIFAMAIGSLTLFLSQGKRNRDWSLPALLFGISVYFSFSLDALNALRYFRFPTFWRFFQGATIASQVVLTIILFISLHRRGYWHYSQTKNERLILLSVTGISVLLGLGAFLAYGYDWARFFFDALTLLLLPLLYFSCSSVVERKKQSLLFTFLLTLLMDIFLSEGLPYCNYRTAVTYLISSFFCLFIAILAFLIFWQESAAIREREEEGQRFKEAYSSAKEEALREQIKPHFVFNCLTAIENSYHQNLRQGDKTMTMFAKHLRNDVDSMDNDLVPFAKELDMIFNYVNLENLRLEKTFPVYFDIDYQDFLIPPLSLQPLVENAIRYSKVNEKEDGFIQIRSYLRDDGLIEVDVEDNGVGFDPQAVTSSSKGLQNAKERLHLLLGAELIIDSTLGKGTMCRLVFQPQKVPAKPLQ